MLHLNLIICGLILTEGLLRRVVIECWWVSVKATSEILRVDICHHVDVLWKDRWR